MEDCNIPDIITLAEFNWEYDSYEKAVYELFEIHFEKNELFFAGEILTYKRHPLHKNKPITFWHIISNLEEGGKIEEDRIPNLRRYERIAWAPHIINKCVENCQEILIWRNKRRRHNRILIWCTGLDYLIVLEDRKEYIMFWTAYPVEEGHSKRKLMSEYKRYCQQKAKNA